MKLCFSTLGCFDRSLEDILLLAKNYNIDAVELRGINGIMENRLVPEYAEERQAETSAQFQRYGIKPLVLGTSCSFHAADQFDGAVAEGVHAVKVAQRLHIPYIRVFGNRYLKDPEPCIKRVIAGLRALCGQSTSVNILLEVHGDFQTVEALSPIVAELKEFSNFGLIWDIEHTHIPYGSNWNSFYTFARPYIKHVHIKDYSDAFQKLTLIGQGDIPILPIVDQMLADGYDGYFSLEWEKKWHPELPDMESALESFLQLLNKPRKLI